MLGWLWDIIAATTAAMTFFSLFLLGTAFSVFSIVFGGHGDSDHDFDHDLGHDTDQDVGSDADHGMDHHDGHDSDSGASNFFSVGVMSVRGMALLSTGFGGLGFLAQIYTGKVLFSTAAGMIGGYGFAFAVLYTLKAFKSQQASSLINLSAAKGESGVVATSIPSGGFGEVRFVVSGMEMVKMAVSKDGTQIRSGTQVKIEQVQGGTLVVTPF